MATGPELAQDRKAISNKGTFNTVAKGFGNESVMGLRRVPKPAQRIKHFRSLPCFVRTGSRSLKPLVAAIKIYWNFQPQD